MLIGIEDLAHEASSEKRRELLNRVTDMFLDGAEDHTDRESTLYADVVLKVLDELGVDDRADYSDTVADHATVPHDIVRHLAGDEISVASAVLSRSPVLTEEDLIEVAENASQDHLHAISNRETLSESITDRLIQRGDTRVVRSVSGNEGARFSPDGLTTLAERSADDEMLRDNLLQRDDLRQQLVDTVLPKVSAEYAQKLRTMIAAADDGTIDQVVGAAEDGIRTAKANAARQRLETRVAINEILSKSRDIDSVIEEFVAQGRHSDIVAVIAKLSSIPDNVVSNVLFKTNNEPVAILMRAIGATTKGFSIIQDIRAQKLRLPASHLEQGMRGFAQLDEQTAKRSLRFVKVRSAVA